MANQTLLYTHNGCGSCGRLAPLCGPRAPCALHEDGTARAASGAFYRLQIALGLASSTCKRVARPVP